MGWYMTVIPQMKIMKMRLYTSRDLLTGLLIYGIGDLTASLLTDELSLLRAVGMALVGTCLYGLEIPHYFRWVERQTRGLSGAKLVASKTALAMLYFNPLWVVRHLAIISWLNGENFELVILPIALKSFVSALPLTIVANIVIQNLIALKYRFMASALFSCFMAITYPLLAAWFE